MLTYAHAHALHARRPQRYSYIRVFIYSSICVLILLAHYYSCSSRETSSPFVCPTPSRFVWRMPSSRTHAYVSVYYARRPQHAHLVHTSAYVSSLSTYVSIRQHQSQQHAQSVHTSAYVSIRQLTQYIRQHTSAPVTAARSLSTYVSIRQLTQYIRQHTSAPVTAARSLSTYVSIRQLTQYIRQHTSARTVAFSFTTRKRAGSAVKLVGKLVVKLVVSLHSRLTQLASTKVPILTPYISICSHQLLQVRRE
jgi:hypothetical protein